MYKLANKIRRNMDVKNYLCITVLVLVIASYAASKTEKYSLDNVRL